MSASTAVQAQGLGLPTAASEHAPAVDTLLYRAHLYDSVLVIAFTGFIVLAVILFRRSRNQTAAYVTGTSPLAMFGVMLVAISVFAWVDGTFLFRSLGILQNHFWNFAIPENDPHTTRVEINAHQWAWDVRYAGPDGTFNTRDDVVLWNELRLPDDAPVYIELAATDVIHSLYLPNFRQKMDAIPGQVNRLWFRPTLRGDFEMACAQHCGTNHYRMRGVVHVVPRAEFDLWLAQSSELASRAYDPADTAAHWGWPWRK